jgi:hypothetical protein
MMKTEEPRGQRAAERRTALDMHGDNHVIAIIAL